MRFWGITATLAKAAWLRNNLALLGATAAHTLTRFTCVLHVRFSGQLTYTAAAQFDFHEHACLF